MSSNMQKKNKYVNNSNISPLKVWKRREEQEKSLINAIKNF